MTRALLYRPGQRAGTGLAFGAAILIHVAALALANIHLVRQTEPAGPPGCDPVVTFEDPYPPLVVANPEIPDPLPTPPSQTSEDFPEPNPTTPPVKRTSIKPVVPLVREQHNSSPGPLNLSSARVFAVSAPRPEYPYEARRQRITGEGVAAMTVDPASGQVNNVSMVKSTGNPFLDNAALTGFRRWRFKPGTVSSVRCPIIFTLMGASY
jgi:protein TonB